MSVFNHALDKFCTKHRKFGVKRLMLYIVVGNILVFLLTQMSQNYALQNLLIFRPDRILRGEIWRLVTFVFIPYDSTLILLAISLFFYYFIGSTLESQWGAGKFTIYYITGVLLLDIYGFVLYALKYYVFLDAWYLNLSMFFAFAVLFPDARVLLLFIIPVKMKWLALLDAALFIFEIVVGTFPNNLIPIVAVLNFLIFCGGNLVSIFKPVKYKYSAQNIHFNQEIKHEERQQTSKPYRHRCDVCGRTDASNPELEFRYCSRCAGYHCYCMDHINTHIHFNE